MVFSSLFASVIAPYDQAEMTPARMAGISAKLVSGQINYVLIAYIVNFLAVSLNLAVYFRNRALDKAQDQER